MNSLGATIPVLDSSSKPAPRAIWRIFILLALLLISASSIYYGLQVRRWLWDYTSQIHFQGDVSNGYRWGWISNRLGLFHVYDNVASGMNLPAMSSLDYTPLRLAVVTAWVHWAEPKYGKSWQDSYDITAPMLWMNTISELASSILVFLLIRMWIVRMKGPGNFRGVVPGLIGALLFWFNPAVIWDGHAWPQWDVWLVPWFLAAVLLACANRWFAAGMCLTVGAFLKGQLLLGAPVLLLWPIFQFRFGAVFRMIAGIAFCTAMIVFPWLNLSVRGFTWFILATCAMAMLTPIVLQWKQRWPWLAGMSLVAMLLAWPWASGAAVATKLPCVLILAVVALSRFMPVRLIPHVYALAIAAAAMVTIPVFNASSAWYTRGFVHGTTLYPRVAGNGMYNLPQMLQTYFRWPSSNESAAYLPFIDTPITFRQQMFVIYGLCLVLSGIGAAIQYRRRDTRFLVAMVAPWVIFYCLLPQMHGRYLVWGAAMSALLAGSGVGLSLLGIFISFISLNGILENQDAIYGISEVISNPLKSNLFALRPHLGWALLLTAAILLYYAVVPRTKSTLM